MLHHMNFKGKVAEARFSPCGRFIAIAVNRILQVWQAPTMLKEFAPFKLLRQYGGMYDDATCLAWSADSEWIMTGCKDLTCRVYSCTHIEVGMCN